MEEKNYHPAKAEEGVLKFWEEKKIFEKSVKKNAIGDFIFYDGPPFATGLPHYGSILPSIIKDVIPRYQTMRGYRVKRRWGWDCHGLPIENLIENELGLKSKKDIEKLGIDKFNKAARNSVLRYAGEWQKVISRIGRWVDMKNDYKTMDISFMESVWWVFKKLYEKGLIYEGYKSMHICPRCETTLANFEVTLNYKDIKDLSVIAKFEILDFGVPSAKSYVQNPRSEILNPKIYLLAWTTTPWTLPGNVALAINKQINYCQIKIKSSDAKSNESYILAKERLNFLSQNYEIIDEFKGSELVGKRYQPLFNYYQNVELDNKKNGWQIYGADFVSLEEGTGVVHIAPAFGEEDMELSRKNNLPFIQHVNMDGTFKKEVSDFVNLTVKPKNNYQATDKVIIEKLKKEDKIFSEKEITHSYPHCWRCETPLLNYAASSWFVNVTRIKDKIIKNNKKINWVPEHIKEGRFGKWLEGARDWAISRTRFWGTPLPVWRCQKCQSLKVVGSLSELSKTQKKSTNNYLIMRHGESETQILGICSNNIDQYHLTTKGKNQVESSLKEIKKLFKSKCPDLIFSSDVLRTRETAEIVSKSFKVRKINFDKRLREINFGVFNNQPISAYWNYFSSYQEKFSKSSPNGESLTDLKKRLTEFFLELDEKYKDKNILIISHEYPLWILSGVALGLNDNETIKIRQNKKHFIDVGQVMKLKIANLPINDDGEIDIHRPYIDKVVFPCSCGDNLKRIIDVFDCWFESGSMPYGQVHYPMSNKNQFEKNFPAQFIAEGLDQTRGWFYTLLVLSTALFNKPMAKNIVVNGLILAENGQKMSKKLKNYPDPMAVIDRYGADALRFYLLASPVVIGENLNFSEKGIDEVYKKVILRLWNVYQFYEMYSYSSGSKIYDSGDFKTALKKIEKLDITILDKWILLKLKLLVLEVSSGLDNYKIAEAIRPISRFIEDLSTWYLRRSRDRFKEEGLDKKKVLRVIHFILISLTKLMAPFSPFVAEKLFHNLGGKEKSVHLAKWPTLDSKIKSDELLLDQMEEVRRLASLALEARAKAGVKVRQPLATLKIKNQKLKLKNDQELIQLIKNEVNIKQVIFDDTLESEILVDFVITPELKAEGDLRELVRIVQEMRRDGGLRPKDLIIFKYQGDLGFIEKQKNQFKNIIKAKKIETGDLENNVFLVKREVEIEKGNKIWLGIKQL